MHNPEHPVYIISKGRADSMITSRSLSRMKVPHYIIIEPQDETLYEKALGCLIENAVSNLPYCVVHRLVYQPHYVPTGSGVLRSFESAFV